METDIEAILIAFIREHCLPQKMQTTLGLGDNLFETGTIDSAGLIHFIGYIEERFDIVIPDEDLIPEKFTTIASIADYIRSRLSEPAVIEEG
ncbi:MAG: acyl carrier protein [Bacteroidia bacterium]|nr:acyl carrier protein [Bacteroidia bacterium]